MDLYAITSQQVLDQISRHCPDAISAYLQCINRADSFGSVYFSREMVRNDLNLGWAKFCNQIKKLALENLLEWHHFDEGISVTLAAFDDGE
jgi:hypothetical protein